MSYTDRQILCRSKLPQLKKLIVRCDQLEVFEEQDEELGMQVEITFKSISIDTRQRLLKIGYICREEYPKRRFIGTF